jgi:hypothetical protein
MLRIVSLIHKNVRAVAICTACFIVLPTQCTRIYVFCTILTISSVNMRKLVHQPVATQTHYTSC